MNKHLHRVIFNKSRGIRMAVQESACSGGKASSGATQTGTARAPYDAPALRTAPRLLAAASLLLAAQGTLAQIAADPGAAAHQRPTVLQAANGVPLVNIQTPSAAGVSRNVYRQFDVGQGGAILNNSRTQAQTQLGGWVQANPWLAAGGARVIVNEVNSSAQSRLMGPLEVAGQRADVVVANPSGLVVDGLTLINAAGVTLATGRPRYGTGGSLDGFDVQGGRIAIEGGGMDATQANYAHILARAISVNAGLWAQDLRMVAGPNQTDVAAGAQRSDAGAASGPPPPFALDVAHLGGMYAGKIFIIGTEAGLGVRSAGTIAATGSLSLGTDGELANAGTLRAGTGIDIAASSVRNSGTIATTDHGAALQIAALGDIDNSHGGTLEAARLLLDSAQGNIDNRQGTMRQTGAGQTDIAALRISNTAGGSIGAQPPQSTGTPGADGGPTPGAGSGQDLPQDGGGGESPPPPGTTPPAETTLPAGRITAAEGALLNDAGRIYAGGSIHAATDDLDNRNGTLELATLAIAKANLLNTDGTLHASERLDASVGLVDNTRGSLQAGLLNMDVQGDILNHDGVIAALGHGQNAAHASIHAGGRIANVHGAIDSAATLDIGSSGDIDNLEGALRSNGDLQVRADSLDNGGGRIHASDGALQLQVSGALANAQGSIFAAAGLDASAARLVNDGDIRSAAGLQLSVTHTLEDGQGRITAAQDLGIHAANLQSTGTLGAGIQADGSLAGNAGLSIHAQGLLSAQGRNLAAGHLQMQGLGLDLSHSETVARDIILHALQDDIVTDGAVLGATRTLSAQANQSGSQALRNTGGLISAQALHLDVANLANTQGGRLLHTGDTDLLITLGDGHGTLDNSEGSISANAHDLAVQAGRILNRGGRIEHAAQGTLSLQAHDYMGAQGHLATNGQLQVQLAGHLDNDEGSLDAGSVSISAQDISNRQGRITHSDTEDLRIATTADLDNTGGHILANAHAMQLDVHGTLTNAGGRIEHAPSAPDALLHIQAATLDNSLGRIASNAALQASTTGELQNRQGQLAAHRVDVAAQGIDNRNGTIAQSGSGAMRLATTGADLDNDGGTIASNSSALSISVAGTLHNEHGILQQSSTDADARATITAHALQGAQGQITIDGDVALQIDALLDHTAARLSAHGISVQAHTIVNDAGEFVQTGHTAAGQITATGALGNRGGTIAGNAHMTLQAQSLDNQGGSILTAAGRDIAIATTGALDNRQGRIASGAGVTLAAGSLDNDHGSLSAQEAIDGQVGHAVINRQGQIAARGSISLQALELDNTGGLLASTGGDLGLRIDQQLTNGSGALQAAQALEIHSTGVDNTAGRIVAQTVALDAGTARIDNLQGNITALSADGTLSIQSGELRNDAGLIQSQGGLHVDTHGKHLSNTQAGLHGGQAGGIVAGGPLTLHAASLDNRNGFIGSGASMHLALDPAAAGAIDNRQGQLLAMGDLALSAPAAALDNRSGLIRSAGQATLAASHIDNGATAGADLGIEGASVALSAQTLANAQGRIVADADAQIDVQTHIDNAQGLLSAGRDIAVGAAGPAPAQAPRLDNDAGRILAGRDMAATVDSLQGKGLLQAGADLHLGTRQTLHNESLIEALGDLSVSSAGDIVNQGTLRAGAQLHVQANGIDNTATGEMSAGAATHVAAAGQLANRGLIDGSRTRIDAAILDNTGSGRIYGDHLSIGADTLLNRQEDGQAGSIAARQRLDIAARDIANENGALIYSGGDLAIGGLLDADGHAGQSAQRLRNAGASIESAGDMVLAAQQLDNLNLGFSTRQEQYVDSAAETYVYMEHNLSGPRYLETDMGRCFKCASDRQDTGLPDVNRYEYVAPSTLYPFEAGYQRSPYILPGQFINVPTETGETIPQRFSYAEDDPVWSLFGVAYGDTSLLKQKLQAYNNDFMNRASRHFTVVNINRRETTQTVVDNHGLAARIVSGGNMDLRLAEGRNDNSQILAGARLDIQGGQLINEETLGTRQVRDLGSWRMDNVEYSPYVHRVGQAGSGAYAVTTIDETIRLGTGRIQEYTAASPSSPIGGQAPSPGTTIETAATGHIAPIGAPAAQPGDVAIDAPAGTAGQGAHATPDAAVGTLAAADIAQAQAGAGASAVMRSSLPAIALPTASIFSLMPGSSATHLVETDPRFADYRQWLSSDYMLGALGLDPGATLKRLGDGFYEQQLIREQIAQLTGQRLLADHASDEAQYVALMNAGTTFAQQYGLRPGIALTPEQVAQLTSDIVWLVEQSVTLPDGSVQRVLVPQVYARVQPADLDGSGALLAGRSLDVRLSGDFTNAGGTVAGRDVARITAGNIANIQGRITGNALALDSAQDLLNTGGRIDAQAALSLQAGRDIISETGTRTSVNQAGPSSFERTGVDRIAGLYVTGAPGQEHGGGVLVAQAGRDIALLGSIVANAAADGQTLLQAGRDIRLDTVDTSHGEHLVADARNYAHSGQAQQVGSLIQAQGSIALQAGRDIAAQAATVDAAGALALSAGRDVQITAGQATRHLDELHTSQGGGFLSKYQSITANQVDATTAQASRLGGDTIAIQAGRDIAVTGSSAVSDHGTALRAGRDVQIAAATETSDETHYRHDSKSGLFGSGGIGFTIGSQKMSTDQQGATTTAAASTVGSIQGDVNIVAGSQYRQVGSDVIAPRGDVNILAQDIAITEALGQRSSEQHTRFKQSGLSVSLSAPVIAMAQTASSLADAAGKTSDARMQALAAGAAALNVYNNQDALKALGNGDLTGGGVSVSVSVGSSKSQSDSYQRAHTSLGSNVQAGGNVNLSATGAGENSNLLVRGSDITAGNNARLTADNDIHLLASTDTYSDRSSNSSSSAAVGVAIGTSGWGITASASRGKGHANSDDTIHNNTRVTAGNAVRIESGQDTNLRGAAVSGQQVIADVGGDLNIQSLQDGSVFEGRQQSAGGSVMVGAGFAASASYDNSRAEGSYASVTEQTGIQAGDGGFQIHVAGNTGLKGAVIASTQEAIDKGRNSLSTGTLSASDIENHSGYEASGVSLSGGFSVAGKPADNKPADSAGGNSASASTVNNGADWSWQNFGKTGVNGAAAGASSDQGSESSTTRSGISQGALTITDEAGQQARTGQSAEETIAGIDRDVRTGDGANGLDKAWDGQQILQEQAANAQIVAAFGQQASRAVGSYVQEARQALLEQMNLTETEEGKAALQTRLDELHMEERVLNVLIGAVAGMGASALTKEILSAAADEMRQIMIEDSRKFSGVVDSYGNVLDNISGPSEGVRGDGIKIGGTRVDLDQLCGPGNERCAINPDGGLDLKDGKIQFIAKKENGESMTIAEFIETPEGQRMVGVTGGIQGYKGTLFGEPYQVGSWQDKLIEAFAGTHDYLGGRLSALYDEQGNATRKRSTVEAALHDRWSEIAIPLAAPFAAAEVLSPAVWQAISTLLREAR